MSKFKSYTLSLVALVCGAIVVTLLLDIPAANNIIITLKGAVSESTFSNQDGGASEKNGSLLVASDFSEKTGKYSYVLSLKANEKKKFLDELIYALKTHGQNDKQPSDYFSNVEALSVVLAQLTIDDDKEVSGTALSIIGMLAWVTHSTSNLPDISQSAEVKAVLEQMVTDSDIDDEFRGVVIDAYSLLYPPNPVMISVFDDLIVTQGVNDGDTLKAIFGAFKKYKRLYNYEMPPSTLKAAKKLIEHPSESVKIEVLSVLSQNVGSDVLPVFYNELETTKTLAVVNSLIMKILSLDQSDETIQKLKDIAAKTPEQTSKARFIEVYTNPKNIERLRSNKVKE